MTGSNIGPGGKKLNKKKKLKTGSIIGPVMAEPTGPFATALLWWHVLQNESITAYTYIRWILLKQWNDWYEEKRGSTKMNTALSVTSL